MRVLVTGSRYADPVAVSADIVVRLSEAAGVRGADRLTIIHGGAPGADEGAHLAALRLGANEYRFPAEWAFHGRAAGPIRNVEMIEEMRPDIVLAYPHQTEPSRGTSHCMRAAQERGIPVEVRS